MSTQYCPVPTAYCLPFHSSEMQVGDVEVASYELKVDTIGLLQTNRDVETDFFVSASPAVLSVVAFAYAPAKCPLHSCSGISTVPRHASVAYPPQCSIPPLSKRDTVPGPFPSKPSTMQPQSWTS